MKTSIWVVALLVICACSQTTSVQQPAVPPPLHTTLDTVNFGLDPLWREADTTIVLKFSKSEPVTSIAISDPNFILLDTMQKNDTLRISLRFQPQTLSNYSSQCLILSKKDTLANLALLGQTSAF